METIDRLFRPGFWRLSVPLLIVATLLAFFAALLSAMLEAKYQLAAHAVGVIFRVWIVADE